MKHTEFSMIEVLLSIMTPYEWIRYILAFANLIAVLGVPFHISMVRKRNDNDK